MHPRCNCGVHFMVPLRASRSSTFHAQRPKRLHLSCAVKSLRLREALRCCQGVTPVLHPPNSFNSLASLAAAHRPRSP